MITNMVLLFGKSNIIYWGGIAVCFGLFLLLSSPLLDDFFHPVFILLICVLMFLFYRLAAKVASREHDKLLAPLTKQCDPEAFIVVYSPFALSNRVKNSKSALFLVNLALGYLEKGDAARSEQLLIQALRPETNNRVIWENGYIFGTLACVQFLQGEEEKAAQSFQKAKLALGRTQGKIGRWINLGNLVSRVQYEFFPQEMNYTPEHCIWFWEKCSWENPSVPYRKVHYHWNLARLYSHIGDTNNALFHCRYVIEHGNKLGCVKQARELMAFLEQ